MHGPLRVWAEASMRLRHAVTVTVGGECWNPQVGVAGHTTRDHVQGRRVTSARRATPDWFPDELGLAGPEHLDLSYVHGYDGKAGGAAAADAHSLRGMGVAPGSTVVDLGTGTGSFALAAADLGYRVIAVDVSEAMLQAAASKAGGDGIEFIQAGFLTYEHAGPQADVVYTRNALHHLPDFWKALAIQRIASMLRPSGLFWLQDIVFSFDSEGAEDAIEAWLASAPARPEDGWTRDELITHLRSEHSTFSWILEPMLERAGFSIRRWGYSESRVFADYICELIDR